MDVDWQIGSHSLPSHTERERKRERERRIHKCPNFTIENITFLLFCKNMRLTSLLFRNGRKPQKENKVPFKALLPLTLKNRVSSKNEITKEHGCLHEISLLLTCLEKNNFEDKKCMPEMNALYACYKTYTENTQRQVHGRQTEFIPNSKTFTHKQITSLLQKYPTV